MRPYRSLIVRPAGDADLEAVRVLDQSRETSMAVDQLIARPPGRILVVAIGGDIVGYAVLGTFFEYDFVEVLFVHPDHRRKGFGTRLMSAAAAAARSGKLFTSTNQSNGPMRRLCERLGYATVGTVEGLDDDDPEIFYLKRLVGRGS